MAFFIDRYSQRYIGVLYLKNDDAYSGNFIAISERTFQIMLKCNRILRKLMIMVICAALILFCFQKTVYSPEIFSSEILDWIYVILGGVVCAVSVIYFACGSLWLSRKKTKLTWQKLRCLSTQSVGIYSLAFWMFAAMIVDMVLWAGIQNQSVLMIFFGLFPMICALVATIYYSRIKNQQVNF
jgi:hypothetical protein